MTQRRQTETSMQMGVVRWARQNAETHACLKWLYHAANEGRVDPREAGKRQSMGVVAGISDLTLPYPANGYHGLFLELKRKPNKLTAEQAAFMEYAEAQGYKTAVCYTLEDAISTIRNYLEGDAKDAG